MSSQVLICQSMRMWENKSMVHGIRWLIVNWIQTSFFKLAPQTF